MRAILPALFVLAVVPLALALAADKPGGKATATYEAAKKALDAAYIRDLKVLQANYLDELDTARKAALTASNLEEAQSIVEKVKQVENDLTNNGPPDLNMKVSKLTVDDLNGRRFHLIVFATVPQEGRGLAEDRLTLEKDGKINRDTPSLNDTTWKVNNSGRLTIYHKDGRATSSYENVFSNGKALILVGTHVDKNTTIVLREIKSK